MSAASFKPRKSSFADHMKSVAIPFLDYPINDISSRFSTHRKQAASLQGLPPVNITVNTSIGELNEAILFYSDDLPNSTSSMKNFVIGRPNG